MRIIASGLLAVFALASLSGAEAADAPDKRDVHAVNTVCPIDGKKIAPTIEPVAAKGPGGDIVRIGVCSDACRDEIAAHAGDYVDDAVKNRRHPPKK